MHPIFTITIQDIQSLNDEQSRELTARLCRAELSSHGISEAAVSWGGDQRAKDGGVDVCIDIDPNCGINGYVKSDRSAYQVKAENFGKAKIPHEMAPKGVLRPAIVELGKDKGAYIIVSTRDSLSASSLSDRVEAMNACLSKHGLSGQVTVDFYDCRKIADWVEHHPAIANWVRDAIGKPLVGWKPYSPWAYKESDLEAGYLLDDRVKVFIPNADEGSSVLAAIDSLRSDLRKNVSVRMVGLSGVGKTRLVQALFDKRIVTESPALDAENVLYADLSDNPTPQPNAMVEALVSEGADCVVVIDNCGQDVHRRLTETVKLPGSKVRLITVEYDIRDDLPEGTKCYRLEGSSDEVIKQLLKRHYGFLSNNDLDTIAEFSDGNARVAYALASSTETTGELAQLHDSELFKRLFVQKHEENDELLRCAEAASLLYSFDGEDISFSSEIGILASFAEISVLKFSRNIAELQRRGLVQQRGKWRAVLPHAISNRLAVRAIEALPKDLLIKFLVETASDRVARSFSRRLSYLHESMAVREIIYDWLKPGGRYGDLLTLNEIERKIFSNIAPVHQEAALQALQRASTNQDFVSTENFDRGLFARIARSLAYEPVLFNLAVEVLVRFAAVEPQGYNRDSTFELLKSLFFSHLSGTEALSAQRAKIVHDLIFSNDQRKEQLGFSLLAAALKTSYFSSSYGFDFGARKRGYGWWPRTYEDIRSWYVPFIEMATQIGKSNSENGQQARLILGESLRGLWVGARLSNEMSFAGTELSTVMDGWPEGWLGTRKALQHDKDKVTVESLEALGKLEQLLKPCDLKSRIAAKVLARGAFADDFDGDDADDISTRISRAEHEAEDLGRAAASEEELLSELLSKLICQGTNSKVYNFGIGVGLEIPNATSLIEKIRDLISTEKRGFNLTFLRGFFAGWQKAKPQEVSAFLDYALDDEVWGKWFPELQLLVEIDGVGYTRVMKSLQLGKAPIIQYQGLAYGRAAGRLTVDQISTLINKILSKDEGGLVALEVLSMVVFSAKERGIDFCQQLADVCISYLQRFDWSELQGDHDHNDYKIDLILQFTLAFPNLERQVQAVLQKLVEFERSKSRMYSHGIGKVLAPFFQFYPKQTLDSLYLADEDGRFETTLRMISRLDLDRKETAVSKVPIDIFLEWCEISPEDRYVFAAETCCLFENASSNDTESNAGGLVLSEAAIRVFAGARDKQAVLNILLGRFYPSGCTGSLAHILRGRMPLLAKLNPTGDEKLDAEIARAEAIFRPYIAAEEEREERRERQQTGSFE